MSAISRSGQALPQSLTLLRRGASVLTLAAFFVLGQGGWAWAQDSQPADEATEATEADVVEEVPAAEPFTIAAGGPFGVGFTVAGAICLGVEGEAGGPPCSVRAISTSADRIRAVDSQAVDAAIVQADWLAQAVAGRGLFESDGPNDRLTQIARLHSEDFVLMVPKDGSDDPSELDGKPIDLQPEGSYPHAIASLLFGAMRLDMELGGDSAIAGFEGRIANLCDGKTVAAGFVAAQPHITLAGAVSRCGVKALGWPEAALKTAVEAFPGLEVDPIPEGLGAAPGAQTVGLRQVLIMHRDTPKERGEALARAVLAVQGDVAGNLAVWRDMTPADLRAKSPVGLHPGALAAYAAAGIN